MGRFPSLKISQYEFPCWRVVEILILVALALASTLLIVFLPEARVYCGIALAVIIIYTFRLWRFLPSDRRRVKIEASRLADAALLSRRAGAGVPFVAQSVQAPVLHAASMQSAAMSFGHNSALHAQQMMEASWQQQQQQQQQQVLMAHSMQLPQQQQSIVSSVFPPQQQALMAHSMQLPQQQQSIVSSVFPPQQQALMAHSMQLPQRQQAMMNNFQTTVHSTRFTPPQPSPVPQMSMPVLTAQHAGDAGNTLPQQPFAHKNAVQFG